MNLRPNMQDSRYVVYYDLLLHLQEEEEKLETEMEVEGKHNSEHKLEFYDPHKEEEKEKKIEQDRRPSHHHCQPVIEERLSLDETLDNEIERVSTKSRKDSKK